jgi:hypothetical protein
MGQDGVRFSRSAWQRWRPQQVRKKVSTTEESNRCVSEIVLPNSKRFFRGRQTFLPLLQNHFNSPVCKIWGP